MERFYTRKLQADERPRAIYDFMVTGQSSFPTDMLRYDACWPASSDDVVKMDSKGLRSVRLRSYRVPTIQRWSSFLWSVGGK